MDARVERSSELESQAVVLDLLRRLFLGGPDRGLIESIGALDAHRLRLDPEAARAIADLVALVGENGARQVAWVEDLQVEYTRLFIGPLDPKVHPYASCYLSANPSVMGEETLAVREAYARSGLVVERLNSLPDDHLGVELEFLFSLTRAAADAEDDETAAGFLDERQEFHRRRVAAWTNRVADGIARESPSSFFRAAGMLLANCLPA